MSARTEAAFNIIKSWDEKRAVDEIMASSLSDEEKREVLLRLRSDFGGFGGGEPAGGVTADIPITDADRLTNLRPFSQLMGQIAAGGIVGMGTPGSLAAQQFMIPGDMRERLIRGASGAGAEAVSRFVIPPVARAAGRGISKLFQAYRPAQISQHHAKIAAGLRTNNPWAKAEFQSLQKKYGMNRANRIIRQATQQFPSIAQGRQLPAVYDPTFAKAQSLTHTVGQAGRLTEPTVATKPTPMPGKVVPGIEAKPLTDVLKQTFDPQTLAGKFSPEGIEYVRVMLEGWPDAPIDDVVREAAAIHGRRRGLISTPDIEAGLSRLGYDVNAGRAMATKEQRQLIHQILRARGVTEKEHHKLIKDLYKVSSSVDMTDEQAKEYLDILKNLSPNHRGPVLSKKTTLTTPEYIDYIKSLDDATFFTTLFTEDIAFAPGYNLHKPAGINYQRAVDQDDARIAEMLDGLEHTPKDQDAIVEYLTGERTLSSLKPTDQLFATYNKALMEGVDPQVAVSEVEPDMNKWPDVMRVAHAVNIGDKETLPEHLQKYYDPVKQWWREKGQVLVNRGELKPEQLDLPYFHRVIYGPIVEAMYGEGVLPELLPSIPMPKGGFLEPRKNSPFWIPDIRQSMIYYSHALNKHIHMRPAYNAVRLMVADLRAAGLKNRARYVDEFNNYWAGRPDSFSYEYQSTMEKMRKAIPIKAVRKRIRPPSPFVYQQHLVKTKGLQYQLTLAFQWSYIAKQSIQWTQGAAMYGIDNTIAGYMLQDTPWGKKLLAEIEPKLMEEAPKGFGVRTPIQFDAKPAIFGALEQSRIRDLARLPAEIARYPQNKAWLFLDRKNRRGVAIGAYMWGKQYGMTHDEALNEAVRGNHHINYGYSGRADSPLIYAHWPITRAVPFSKWPIHQTQLWRVALSDPRHQFSAIQYGLAMATLYMWGRKHKMNLAAPISTMSRMLYHGPKIVLQDIVMDTFMATAFGHTLKGKKARKRLERNVKGGFHLGVYKMQDLFNAYLDDWHQYDRETDKEIRKAEKEHGIKWYEINERRSFREQMREDEFEGKHEFTSSLPHEIARYLTFAAKPPKRIDLKRKAAKSLKKTGSYDEAAKAYEKMRSWGMPIGAYSEWQKEVRKYMERELEEE